MRDDPARPGCFLLEFYDTRHAGTLLLLAHGQACKFTVCATAHVKCFTLRFLPAPQLRAPLPALSPSPAAAALQGISQLPDMASRLVVMEAGAAASAVPAVQQAPSLPPAVQQQPVQPLGPSLSHDYLAAAAAQQPGGQYGGGMRNVGSSPALLYGSTQGSSSQLDYLQGGMAAAASLQQLQQAQQAQQQAQAAAAGGFPDPATAQLLSAAGLGAAGLSAASLQGVADPLASMNRSFSEMSLDSTAGGLGSRFAPNSLSTGDLLAMTQGLQGEQCGGWSLWCVRESPAIAQAGHMCTSVHASRNQTCLKRTHTPPQVQAQREQAACAASLRPAPSGRTTSTRRRWAAAPWVRACGRAAWWATAATATCRTCCRSRR